VPTYDARSAGVTAPKLLTPQVYRPFEPAAPRSASGPAILIVVNEDGTVDTVKATFVPTTVGDNMLMTNALSVAKTWKFRPAEKDGLPVKYQLIVPLSVF
jgi:outer membrane biosynthesis protein TonB